VGCECTEGVAYYAETQSIKGFQPETLTLIEQGLPFSSPFSFIAHHFHGAASRVGASETAFAAGSSNG